MVKKSGLLKFLVAFSIILSLFFILSNFWNYKYPNFVFNKPALIFIISAISIFDVITLILLSITSNKSLISKSLILLPILGILLFLTFVVLCVFTVGVFWESKTTDFNDFSGTDTGMYVRIAGLTIDDITESEIKNVEEFYYSYNSVFLADSFKFKGKFTFSEERYHEIKNAFLTAPEFSEVKYDVQQSSEYGMSGEFIVDITLPMYVSKTSVERWEKVIIRFNDETLSFYFDLDGEYDT